MATLDDLYTHTHTHTHTHTLTHINTLLVLTVVGGQMDQVCGHAFETRVTEIVWHAKGDCQRWRNVQNLCESRLGYLEAGVQLRSKQHPLVTGIRLGNADLYRILAFTA